MKRVDHLARIDTSGGASACWPYRGPTDAQGYGMATRSNKGVRAHRLAWEEWRGEIPAGMFVLHRCNNEPCCNPDHLYIGTQLENVADQFAAGNRGTHKLVCKHGHAMTPENTYVAPKTQKRGCKTCRNHRHRREDEQSI